MLLGICRRLFGLCNQAVQFPYHFVCRLRIHHSTFLLFSRLHEKMIFPIFPGSHAHICLETAGKSLMGIKAILQRHLQYRTFGVGKLSSRENHFPPGHISHDTVPYSLPKQPLVMIFGKMNLFRQRFHGEPLLNPLLYYSQGAEYWGLIVHPCTSCSRARKGDANISPVRKILCDNARIT